MNRCVIDITRLAFLLRRSDTTGIRRTCLFASVCVPLSRAPPLSIAQIDVCGLRNKFQVAKLIESRQLAPGKCATIRSTAGCVFQCTSRSVVAVRAGDQLRSPAGRGRGKQSCRKSDHKTAALIKAGAHAGMNWVGSGW